MPINADHITISKPLNSDAEIYRRVRGRIVEIDLMNRSKQNTPSEHDSLPSPPALPHVVMKRQANKWVERQGYLTRHGIDYATCTDSCQSDPRCQMIEYVHAIAKCNHFEHTRIAGRTTGIDVATKIDAGNPNTRVAGFMRRLPGMHIPGKGYDTISETDPIACLLACQDDARCQAAEYRSAQRNCSLFDHQRIRPQQKTDGYLVVKKRAGAAS